MSTYVIVSIVMLLILVSSVFMFNYAAENESNNFLGFRTKKSSSSAEMWKYSNKYCASILAKYIVLYLVVAISGYIYINVNNVTDSKLIENIGALPVYIGILVIFLSIITTHLKIKNK